MTNKESMQKLFSILHDDRFSWTQESVNAFYVALEKLKNSTEELKNSNDCISRQAAIDAVIKRDANCGIDSAEVLELLPSAQPDVPDTNVGDMISRQAAIDAVYKCANIFVGNLPIMVDKADAYEALAQLPSVQPTSTNAPNTLEPLDCVDRKAVLQMLTDISYNHCKTQGEAEVIGLAKTMVSVMPSAQPEPIWGLPVSADRPLADREIVSRLRDIQKQVGGSYAIDRAIEIIEVVAERRTDEPDK